MATNELPQQNKSVVLMSNIRPGDTLNDFSNSVPDQFLHPHYKHRIAVSSIGLHTEFKSPAVPPKDAYPVVIQMFRKDWRRLCQSANPSQHSAAAAAASNKTLTLSMFRPQDCYFIDRTKNYTNQELHQHFENAQVYYNTVLRNKFKGFLTQLEANNALTFGQFGFPWQAFSLPSRRRLHQTFLLFHENFAETLELTTVKSLKTVVSSETIINEQGQQVQKAVIVEVEEPAAQPSLQSVTIGTQRYVWFLPSNPSSRSYTYVRSSTKDKVQVQVPKLLYVLCPNIVPGLVDGSFQPLLKRFPLVVDAEAEYASFHFKNLEFVDVVTDISEVIHITLCDELLRKIRLTPGFATQVSLIVQSRPQYLSLTMNPQERFVIHVNSRPTLRHPDNMPHKFTVELPRTLHFDTGMWQVSLSHLIFPSAMRRLQSLNLSMSISVFADTLTVAPKTSETRQKRQAESVADDDNVVEEEEDVVEEEVVVEEANVVEDTTTSSADTEPNNGQANRPLYVTHVTFPVSLDTCADIVDHFKAQIADVATATVWPTGPLCLKFKKKAKIDISPTLAFLLGYIDLTPGTVLTIDSDQAHPDSKMWLFPHRPQVIQLHPASLYIYSDHLCDFSFVGDKSRPLLAIVKVPHRAGQPPVYVDHEVKDEVFHPVMYNHVKTLDFTITSHDDAPIAFASTHDDVTVFLTLAFKRQSV